MRDRFHDRKKLIEIIKKNRDKLKWENRKELPSDYFIKCSSCKDILIAGMVEDNLHLCPKCGFHLRMPLKKRFDYLFDDYELKQDKVEYKNRIDYPSYLEKLEQLKESAGTEEAVKWGVGMIGNNRVCFFALDPVFLMGSMGSYVGEQVTKAFEYASENELPVLGISASGGARMQEGIFSLMQMAKTMGAIKRFYDKNLFYLSLLTHPTTGGVSASFALMGDINIAEPGALIGFAGPRVIKETIGEELPIGFQTSEFVCESGFIDMVVGRRDLRKTIEKLMEMHQQKVGCRK